MASSAKSLPLLLLLAVLSSQISHARDSQFFSKVPAATTSLTAKESVVEVNPNRQQEPTTLIQADTQKAYGHESGQVSPTTTSAAATTTITSEPYTATNDLPFETQFQEPYSYYNKRAYVTKPQGYVPTTHFFNTHPQNGGYTAGTTGAYNNYDNSQQLGMSDLRRVDPHWQHKPLNRKATPPQFQEPYSYYNKHAYVTKPQGYVPTTHFFNTHPQNGGSTAGTTAAYNNYDNSQQLGMSDTRFLENGKYYYDPKSEYSNKGYYGNHEKYSYENRKYSVGDTNEWDQDVFQGGFEP